MVRSNDIFATLMEAHSMLGGKFVAKNNQPFLLSRKNMSEENLYQSIFHSNIFS